MMFPMVEVNSQGCKVAVFVCVNERSSEKSSCLKVGGLDFYFALKERIKNAKLQHSHWVSRTGCLGFCNAVGTTVCIVKKPQEPKWFNEITMDDLESIWKEIL